MLFDQSISTRINQVNIFILQLTNKGINYFTEDPSFFIYTFFSIS
jgi:hypothetical protein